MKTDLEKGLNTFMSDNSQDLLTMNTNYTETKMAGQNIIFCKKVCKKIPYKLVKAKIMEKHFWERKNSVIVRKIGVCQAHENGFLQTTTEYCFRQKWVIAQARLKKVKEDPKSLTALDSKVSWVREVSVLCMKTTCNNQTWYYLRIYFNRL